MSASSSSPEVAGCGGSLGGVTMCGVLPFKGDARFAGVAASNEGDWLHARLLARLMPCLEFHTLRTGTARQGFEHGGLPPQQSLQ